MSDRWVCKRCFADNEESDAACGRCGLLRGAESSADDQATWQATVPKGASDAPWRRWIRFWWVPAIAIALAVGWATSARRGDDGALASAGTLSIDELRAGDCFNAADADEISEVDAVPCTEPHAYEVFAVATYEGDGSYPPDSSLPNIFNRSCAPEFEVYVGTSFEASEIHGSMISPSEDSWGSGDRSFICLLFDPTGATLTESLAGSER